MVKIKALILILILIFVLSGCNKENTISGNSLELNDLKECCKFIDENGELKSCLLRENYSCDLCKQFCEPKNETAGI
ncbi:hypothetical protein J4468_03660 [Candidatus Woesearchaeota archaeon]|nr:hypothetical protein [Candidatus Woesearchaeota archaeon]